ncbi:MAG: VCBS repeat-containing protein, partial [Chloroflexi bacterium]|nr:VCBS repeat-containing protein [Chloroflexota bacterium]
QSLTVPDIPTTGIWRWQQIASTSLGEALDTADIDQDGDQDVSQGLEWLRNDAGSWTPFTIHTPLVGETDRTHLVDMDEDGDLDSVIGYGHDPEGKLAWYERPSDPTQPWTEHLIANLVNPQSVSVADMDIDGDLDIVVGEHRLGDPENSRLIIFENMDGQGGAWIDHLIHVGDEHHDGTQVADLDNDGDLDIFSIGWKHSLVLVYENKLKLTFTFLPLVANNN